MRKIAVCLSVIAMLLVSSPAFAQHPKTNKASTPNSVKQHPKTVKAPVRDFSAHKN